MIDVIVNINVDNEFYKKCMEILMPDGINLRFNLKQEECCKNENLEKEILKNFRSLSEDNRIRLVDLAIAMLPIEKSEKYLRKR